MTTDFNEGYRQAIDDVLKRLAQRREGYAAGAQKLPDGEARRYLVTCCNLTTVITHEVRGLRHALGN